MKSLADFVLPGFPVCDVGTDHGIVPIYILEEKIAPFVILSDINSGPLEKAKHNLSAAGIDPARYDLRLCGGLEGIQAGEAASVIIAGMGGELIASIMAEDPEKSASFSRFILQPRTRTPVLRKWLSENGFRITEEKLVKEAGRICEILAAEPGIQQKEDEICYEFPRLWFQNREPLLEEYLKNYILHAERILSQLSGSASDEGRKEAAFRKERRDYAAEKLQELLKNP